MNTNSDPIEALQDIRALMNRSSRFLSLSGLSGFFIGCIALMGSYVAHDEISRFNTQNGYALGAQGEADLRFNLIKLALIVLIVALAAGVLFSYRKSQQNEWAFWDKTAKQLLVNLSIPLITGALFITSLLFRYENAYALIAASTLIFYGLALVNASKYTYNDIRYLGILEILLGLTGLFMTDYSLIIWAMGFGVLHIIYGLIMYFKYEKQSK